MEKRTAAQWIRYLKIRCRLVRPCAGWDFEDRIDETMFFRKLTDPGTGIVHEYKGTTSLFCSCASAAPHLRGKSKRIGEVIGKF